MMQRIEAIQTSEVSGASKFKLSAAAVRLFGDRLVDEVGDADMKIHQEPHGEDPDDQLDLHRPRW